MIYDLSDGTFTIFDTFYQGEQAEVSLDSSYYYNKE